MVDITKINESLKAHKLPKQPKKAAKKLGKQIKVSLVVPDRKRLAPNQRIITITRPFVAAR